MAFDLSVLAGKPLLAEESHLRRALAHLAALREWPSAREVARERKRRLEDARHIAAQRKPDLVLRR